MAWKPSGALIRIDLNLSLDETLLTLEDIGLEEGLGNIQGFHYSLDGSSERIVTMPDEYESFQKRINDAGKGAKIVIRPVDPVVGYLQHFGGLWY